MPGFQTFKPRGVELHEPSDFDALRTHIGDKAMEAVQQSFPRSFGGVRLEAHDLHFGPEPDRDPNRETEYLLNDK